MIILRQRCFSFSDRKMIDEIIENLEKDGVEDFEIVPRIPRDVVSISVDSLGMLKIYLPMDYEYNQYDIDDFIRRNLGHQYRTTTSLDRNIYIQKVSLRMGAEQIAKVIGYIIEETEFCAIIE